MTFEPILLRAGEAEAIGAGGSSIAFLAGGDTTGGRLTLTETTLAPGFRGPLPHRHRELVDSFYVLEGTLTVRVGDATHELPPGSFAAIPPGTVHTFANRTDAPVRMLNLNVPGGFEGYLRGVAQALATGRPPDPAEMARLAADYDFEPVE